MYKVAEIRKVMWPIVISVPQDGGKVQKHEMDVEFEILDQDEHDDLVNAGGNLLDRVVHGWARYREADGQTDVLFTADTKAKFLKPPYNRVAVLKGYYEASQGRKAERKN